MAILLKLSILAKPIPKLTPNGQARSREYPACLQQLLFVYKITLIFFGTNGIDPSRLQVDLAIRGRYVPSIEREY